MRMEKALQARYQRALKRIGGALALTALPEQIKKVLKEETRLEVKVRMLEEIADRLGR